MLFGKPLKFRFFLEHIQSHSMTLQPNYDELFCAQLEVESTTQAKLGCLYLGIKYIFINAAEQEISKEGLPKAVLSVSQTPMSCFARAQTFLSMILCTYDL